jgi:hypothetical protein
MPGRASSPLIVWLNADVETRSPGCGAGETSGAGNDGKGGQIVEAVPAHHPILFNDPSKL